MKQILSSILRRLNLMSLVDKGVFKYNKFKNKKVNDLFINQNPEVLLPPDYLMYESFQLNYQSYYYDSIESAKWIVDLVSPYINLNGKVILDWGCGPARIVRHLPEFIENAFIFGTDYNEKSIKWCDENIPSVSFSTNGLNPPTDFNDEKFDFIYGISIFTHLSEEMHQKWIDELHRILKEGGVMMLTTHGKSFKKRLTSNELVIFESDQIVIRGNTIEGHRSYVAFQPKEYFKSLLVDFNVLSFQEGEINSSKPQQDIWIIERK